MEDLREKVYECTLAVEAHMICDLLARAGISARVEGEFLAGAGGDLPLGNTVKVRVDAARAAEAREVIAEWERAQPPPETSAAAKRSPFRSPLWFAFGALAGAMLTFFALRDPVTREGVDYDGDGRYDVRLHYAGNILSLAEYDRDGDGEVDQRWTFDLRGFEEQFETDDDFDGRFETRSRAVERGWVTTEEIDADGDGHVETTRHYRHGVLRTVEFHRDEGTRVLKRDNYVAGLLVSADFDGDGDGAFERHVEYDRFGAPK
jgi:hypothetical protein